MEKTPDDTEMIEEPEKTKDAIEKLFFGQIRTCIQYKDTEQKDQTKEVSDKFSDILLNVAQEKDIYASWENEYQSKLDNYEIDDGVHVKA